MTGKIQGLSSQETIELDIMTLLMDGKMEEQGVIPWSSNYAFLVTITMDGNEVHAIYKPRRGERPLWDFPVGTLYKREVAAYLLSESLRWGLVPPTVLSDGPFGLGSVQLFIASDPEQHYFNLYPRLADKYRRIALFDVVANNADRKAGHCLFDGREHIWSIDHGVCFHSVPKLRTVIWEFAGEPIATSDLADLRGLLERLQPGRPLADAFDEFLNADEIAAMRDRLESLIVDAHFPIPDPNRRNHPWPPI